MQLRSLVWCVCRCGSWEVGLTQCDPSVKVQNNYPLLPYAFALPNLVLLLNETPAGRGHQPGHCGFPTSSEEERLPQVTGRFPGSWKQRDRG